LVPNFGPEFAILAIFVHVFGVIFGTKNGGQFWFQILGRILQFGQFSSTFLGSFLVPKTGASFGSKFWVEILQFWQFLGTFLEPLFPVFPAKFFRPGRTGFSRPAGPEKLVRPSGKKWFQKRAQSQILVPILGTKNDTIFAPTLAHFWSIFGPCFELFLVPETGDIFGTYFWLSGTPILVQSWTPF